MVIDNTDINKWRKDQIKFFKEYLGFFENGSKEHNLIKKGIEDLENS